MKGIGVRSSYRKTELPSEYTYNVRGGAAAGANWYGVRGVTIGVRS
jgi:hypothetical protein